jgi:hypothetical protein
LAANLDGERSPEWRAISCRLLSHPHDPSENHYKRTPPTYA